MGTTDAAAVLFALQHFMAALLDDTLPAGDLLRIVRSTRQGVIEGDALHSNPAIAELAEELARELCSGPGMWTEDERDDQ